MTETELQVKAQIEKYKNAESPTESTGLDPDTKNKIAFAKELKEALKNELFGQNEAIETVVNSMKNDLGENKKAPKATYLF